MITKNSDKKGQIQMISLDQLVPEDHLLRKIDKYVDFSFIYDLVEDKYSPDFGRPSLDPVTLIKLPLIQCMFGIKSMRQTMKEIEVNVAYRWFLGLDFFDDVPHFSTFGKNYKRRFEGTDLFEQIFTQILLQCMKQGLVDTSTFYVDATHVKAAANSKKSKKILVAKKTARFYDEQLREEIDKDREDHDKKPLKDKDDDDNNGGNSPSGGGEQKEKKVSTTDPESGWFHKGEHKEVFAYSVEAASDKHGWIMGYTIHPGNEHDSQTFPAIYEKLKEYAPEKIVIDAGYKTPAIAKMLIDDGITPIMPYKRPMTKKGFFRKSEYVYDELYDCYICPNDQILSYRTTNRDGYREYKSDPIICVSCPYLSQCTKSKLHQKTVVRHVWEDYLEQCEYIRQTVGMKDIYDKRKQTIERIFGTAKEHHGMRYTQMIGKAKMSMKVGLTFACMNMKKLVKIMDKRFREDPDNDRFFMIFRKMSAYI
jgi:transposase